MIVWVEHQFLIFKITQNKATVDKGLPKDVTKKLLYNSRGILVHAFEFS